jgi:hypothetical protein
MIITSWTGIPLWEVGICPSDKMYKLRYRFAEGVTGKRNAINHDYKVKHSCVSGNGEKCRLAALKSQTDKIFHFIKPNIR